MMLLRPVLTAAAVLAFATAAVADDAKDVVKMRHEKFEQLGKAFKTVADAAKKKTPDLDAVRADADQVDSLAKDLPSWFPAGSGPDAGIKTGAKPEIWTQADVFHAVALDLQTQAGKLKTVAAAGDRDALLAQLKATGDACGACHDKFRKSLFSSLFGG